MNFHIMTLFPEIIHSYMGESIMKRGTAKGDISYKCWNIRDYSKNKHRKVDDYPYGGGAGMVMTVDPIVSCYNHIKEATFKKPKVIYLTPKGEKFTNEMAVELSEEDDLVLLCGHYEGIDQRAIDMIVDKEVSIGDYVLTGGELPALVLIDSISRHVKGVLGDDDSLEEESFSDGLLEYPHYTRPAEYEGLKVPEVLLSGNHKHINEYRKTESLKLTLERRPDILDISKLSKEDIKILEKLKNIDKQSK